MERWLARRIKATLCVCIAILLSASIFSRKAFSENSQPYGKSLAGWMEIYERWAFGQTAIPTDSNGNAVVNGVVLLPIPKNAFGKGNPANIEVKLNVGQPFTLPLWVLLGTSYEDGTSDPFEPLSIFRTLAINFTVDGHTLINSRNAMDYFSKFEFIPSIPVSFPPINGIVWFEGIGLVQEGLESGRHTLTLDAKNTQPAFGTTFEYHNTWNVHVK
jgi:hypothetical protein